ncbi:hypothetical protein CFIMG_002305RA [Ceratocystis fimbriata CBS 114723]|uniref:Uncharacterized protein n=2 Tax=Ceratocystis TaxID=5157 RepID=A0A0F8BUG4_CERFI|nr:hypothetical protein CFO_g1430 [Ceratocystis platani]PHH52849.1 hypothetical protein CFIMG_002305RA [Ceratocystis fimbriata CBS 114723]
MQPTTSEPLRAAPMAAVAKPASVSSSAANGPIVTQQPPLQPRPDPSSPDVMRLRGGGFSCGCDCCDGSLRFHKHCC